MSILKRVFTKEISHRIKKNTYKCRASKLFILYNGEFGFFRWISNGFVVSTSPFLMIFCSNDVSAGEICSFPSSGSDAAGVFWGIWVGLAVFVVSVDNSNLVTYTIIQRQMIKLNCQRIKGSSSQTKDIKTETRNSCSNTFHLMIWNTHSTLLL